MSVLAKLIYHLDIQKIEQNDFDCIIFSQFMNTNNFKEEWQKLMKEKLAAVAANNDDLQIEIQQPKTNTQIKKQTIDFYMNRVRHRNEQTKVRLQGEKKFIPQTATKKLLTLTNDKNVSIHAPTKEQEKQKKISINVEQQSSKKNYQIYKQSLFGNNSQPNISQPSEKKKLEKQRIEVNLPSPQKFTYEKQKKIQQQMKIIQDMNVPRWKVEQSSRKQRNKQKYPNSNTVSYNQHPNVKTKSTIHTLNARSWQSYERNQQQQKSKKKEKEQQENEKEQQKKQLQKKKREREKQADMQELFQGMMGMPTKKIKSDNMTIQVPQNNKDNNQTLLNIENIKQINAEDENQIQENQIQENQIQENQIQENQQKEFTKGRQNRIGLRDIIKPKNYQICAPGFIRSILNHHYGCAQNPLENKKIPQIFQDQHIYKKTFHYLIMNQCIADIGQRLKTIKKISYEPISITINNVLPNNDGLIQVYMKEKGKDGVFQLKNISLSKYRLGIVTSQSQFSKQMYGVPSRIKDQFAFLVLLVTPQTKQDLDAQVRSLASINTVELQYILKSRRHRQAYFYDLDKLTTHIREYLAVSNINYSEISPAVLDPRILQKETANRVQKKQYLNDILQHLHNIFNQTQWQSIRQMALREKGFVLLQGPPGTGKTSTLMGLLSAQYQYLKKTGDNRKIMICAPSNAAVNHIVKRIQCEGLFNGNGDIIHPNILRVGIVQTLDTDIRAVSLDQLCERKIFELNEQFNKQSKMTSAQIKQVIISLQKQIRKLKIKNNKDKEQLNKKQADLIKYEGMMFNFRKQKVVLYRRSYYNIECQLLNKAEIILTTLSSTGNEKLDRIRGDIACLIVDEAAQATEPNLLIALQTGVDKVILIGDPYQLPATCMSADANVTLFNRSLFERFLDANIKPYFLNIQYRMAPLIRQFPSCRFYQNRLIDSESVQTRTMPQFLNQFDKRNVYFLDIKYGQQRKMGQSSQNIEEARVISILISLLFDKSVSLGVITPYQAQRRMILKECKQQMKDRQEERQLIQSSVMINTVDSFQGQEKDIIIVSTVRANNRNEVGFLMDERRINVTLTRSKYLLIVVGNGNTLGSNEVWNQFLERVEHQKCYYQIFDNHLLTKDISQTFQGINLNPISRRRHKQLSSDIRKIQRSQIESKDFKIKKKKNEIQDQFTTINGNENRENSRNGFTIKTEETYVVSTKYALDIKQSQMIVEQKKRRQQQAIKQEQMHIRIRKLEQACGGAGDDFYRQISS